MAAPTILETYPNDEDVGIPIGQTAYIQFDRGVDLQSVIDHIVMYGPDFDMTSGPDSALWIDFDTGNNPYFLHSPGFKGLVPLTFELKYWDLDSDTEVTSPPVVTGEADETGYGIAGMGHRVLITPKNPLAADASYTLFVIGDPDTLGRGISSRTVFDVVPDGGNGGSTGSLAAYGGYTGLSSDTVNIRITTAGDIGTAKYKWWYTSWGEGAAITGRVTSRRFRRLEDGLQIRFTGSGFVLDDLYTFNVETIERLATNTKVDFTTNDGTYTAPPASPATPATCTPPSTLAIPGAVGSDATTLYLLEMDPEDGSYNNALSTRTITLTFSEDLDSNTVTNSTVRLFLHDVEGYYQGTAEPEELQKELTVASNTITIEF